MVYITATFPPFTQGEQIDLTPVTQPAQPVATSAAIAPVPTLAPAPASVAPLEHIVQPGDTLSGIALRYNTTVNTLLSLNPLDNPNILSVGQVIALPPEPDDQTPAERLIPDSRLVRGTESRSFDIAGFIASQPGYVRVASGTVTERLANGQTIDRTLTSAQIVERISLEFSVDPRLLLSLLEYRAGWLTRADQPDELKSHPLISEQASLPIDRTGLYRQLAWAANELNRGYYGWKYDDWRIIEFADGTRLAYDRSLNAGTVGLQHMLRLANTFDGWRRDISADGLMNTYRRFFGDPFAVQVTEYVPQQLIQPPLDLPFERGQTWFFTGGAHGGWGSGSAWAAVDFAPPDDPRGRLCYVSDYWVTAVADGVVTYSRDGTLLLDLDGDGDDTTGWVIVYLHLAAQGRRAEGERVSRGDPVGRASCEGGFSTATHLHIARRYNGEWIPATCLNCTGERVVQSFTMSGWAVVALRGQEYQGYLERNGERRVAEQGRISPVNRVTW